MEDPLIGRESRGGGTDRIVRRSEAITHGTTFQKAAALVDLAEDGIGLPEQILDQSSFGESAKYYFIFTRLDLIWSLNYFALILINFFEQPLWCENKPTPSCKDRDYYYLGELPYLTNAESIIYEVITLAILLVHTFSPISYEGSRIFWTSRLNLVKVACVVILFVDVVVDILYLSPLAFDFLPFRIAPYVRVIIFILSIRELRDSLVLLSGMLGTYLNILALWMLFLLFASWIAFVMFEDTQQGLTLFNSYGATLYQMFILFTTSNNPDVWIPAYKSSRWSSLFFVLYVLIGVYFVTNLILAVVYDSFKEQLAKQVSGMDRMKKRMLEKAFGLIDTDKTGVIDKEQCIKLFEQLTNYRTLPKISKEEFGLIFDELDDTRDFKINKDEFADLCQAIALRFQKEEVPSLFENFPQIYHSALSQQLRAFVRSPNFGYAISFILILNFIAVVVETTLDIEESSAQKPWQVAEFVFGWIYVMEMALKIYSYGFENYWRDGQNRFDFIITWVIVIGETATFITPDENTFFSNGEWIRYLLLARMLRLIRLLMHVQRYRAFIATFITLIPSLMPYLGTIFCVLCIYCSIGVQVFGGLVNAGNKQLFKTELAEEDYLLFNFNDYPNGMVTLFNLLVMGNWQVWMESYKDLTGTWWSITYFVSFYIITVLLLLNLIVAFVLEAFFTELDLEEEEKCQGQDSQERRNRRRSAGSRAQGFCFSQFMASASSKTEAETAEIASTAEPIETTTDESDVSISLNEDKSDSNPEEDDSSDESDGEEEDGDSIVDDGDSTDNQPEWGVDSYDESGYFSPDEDSYSDEEAERKARLYRRNLHFSHGFLVEEGIRPRQLWSGSIDLNSLDSEYSPVKGRTQLQYAQDMAKLSLRKYNALNDTDVKLDHVVRVTESFCGTWTSYITFMARETEEEEATLVEYQAKVEKKLSRKSYPIFCRPSPKQDQDL
ncbi:unnamed protein product [Thlaspi arvense]|uniref:EF-hand domain-containing protein n=1 Tax=Thlaspi arvense TaxID=13288 RepID=A0AAU9SRS0_THLAR|nr:unnamed protein product [Thlaspi arvense]